MRLSKHILLYTITICFTIIALVLTATPTYDKLLEVEYSHLTPEAKKQVDCLADNIYHEAGHEPDEGKLAVALVTLNRLNDPRYPKDVCGVVKQRLKKTCQFSWVCMKVVHKRGSEVYDKAREVALFVYSNYEKISDVTQGALFYHADYVNPRWRLEKTVVIGRHIFYREGDTQNDAKDKSTTRGRRVQQQTFVLSPDGRNKPDDLQVSDRMDS